MPAVSNKQQKFMGIVRGIQKGTVPKSYSKKAATVADEIDPGDAEDFAKKESMSLSNVWESILFEQSDISPKEVYYSLGDQIIDIRYLASAHENDSELIKIYTQFKALHAKLKTIFDSKFGKWD